MIARRTAPVSPRRAAAALILSLAFMAGVLAATPAAAQDRSDTGRRKPQVPPAPASKQKVPEAAAPVFTAGGENWLAGVGFGSMDGGDLFRVSTVGGVVVPWGEDGRERFSASRFSATVDPGAAVSAFAARRLGRGRWWLRGEALRGASNVAAEALLGQGGEIYQYDRLTFVAASLGLEARLTAWPSHPYGGVGLTVCRLSAERADDLSQTALGAQATLGYRQRLGRSFLAVEAHLKRMAIDLKGFRPATANDSEPALDYQPAEELWLFEVRMVASRAW